jgi:predicted alpha/beta superfamily hydrolase
VAGIVSPDVEVAWNIFGAEDLRHALICVPALVVNAGCEDISVAPVLLEILGIADVGQIVRRDVEVAVVVVVPREKVGGVEGAAHGEHGGEDLRMPQRNVQCVIAAEAAADGGELSALVLLTKERQDLLHQILLVLHVPRDPPSWRDGAVIPAFGVDRVDADELQVAVFEFVVDDIDHTAVFKLEETAAGCGKDEYGKAGVPEDEQFHVAPEGWGEPSVIFAFHVSPSASLMQSYFTGAVAFALEPLNPSFYKASLEREPISARSDNDPNSEHIPDAKQSPDALDTNPRYSVREFHSEILPDDRTVSVYLPPQYLEQEERRFPVLYLQDGQNLFDGRTSYIAGRTWNASTTADSLAEAGEIEPVILVGVANTGLRRMAEYTPTRDFKMGGGEGRSYGRMLIEELKPLIDSTYRTLPEASNTGVGGSSLGGLISLYLGFANPGVFGKVAVMSPSLWWDHRSILNAISQQVTKPDLRIWLDMGTAEGARHLRDADMLERMLLKRGWRNGVDLAYVKAEGAVHDEGAWSDRFGDVLRFLFPA